MRWTVHPPFLQKNPAPQSLDDSERGNSWEKQVKSGFHALAPVDDVEAAGQLVPLFAVGDTLALQGVDVAATGIGLDGGDGRGGADGHVDFVAGTEEVGIDGFDGAAAIGL